ncbi:hypothetical protein V8E36_006170 [Tilletia maclaganii]
MPYMPHNLGGVIYSSNVQWSIPQVKLYAKQLIEALSSLHDQGIIHGDLKPSNILLSANHHLKLTDFGMSEFADYPEERRVICSRFYRAPEILLRTPRRTTASDVWSLGVVLAEMLGRRVPWTGATAFDTLQAILYHTGAYSPLFVGADQLPGAYQGSDDDTRIQLYTYWVWTLVGLKPVDVDDPHCTPYYKWIEAPLLIRGLSIRDLYDTERNPWASGPSPLALDVYPQRGTLAYEESQRYAYHGATDAS